MRCGIAQLEPVQVQVDAPKNWCRCRRDQPRGRHSEPCGSHAEPAGKPTRRHLRRLDSCAHTGRRPPSSRRRGNTRPSSPCETDPEPLSDPSPDEPADPGPFGLGPSLISHSRSPQGDPRPLRDPDPLDSSRHAGARCNTRSNSSARAAHFVKTELNTAADAMHGCLKAIGRAHDITILHGDLRCCPVVPQLRNFHGTILLGIGI
mmetsp:Transcript_38941/g.87492  ORF Transcript_38941/g.87492 Transcript_38941/m.87492 type:complete len:205 (+) Transcript_38941:1237-1851(+)